MTISQMKEKELNNPKRMELCYISQKQLDYLNNYNEKRGSTFRWDTNEMKALLKGRNIEFEDVEGWIPCLIYVNRITFDKDRSNYCFPVVFGRGVRNVYACAQDVAVPDDVEMKMIEMMWEDYEEEATDYFYEIEMMREDYEEEATDYFYEREF